MKRNDFKFFLLIFSLNSCLASKTCPINMLTMKNENLITVLNDIHEQRLQNEEWKNVVFVLKISNSKTDSTKLRVSIINKNDIAWYLRDKLDNTVGFFVNQLDTVLVFGDYSNGLLNLTEKKKTLTFVPCKETIKENISQKDKIAEPPVSFEPQVWEYIFSQNKIIFKEKGMLNLLE